MEVSEEDEYMVTDLLNSNDDMGFSKNSSLLSESAVVFDNWTMKAVIKENPDDKGREERDGEWGFVVFGLLLQGFLGVFFQFVKNILRTNTPLGVNDIAFAHANKKQCIVTCGNDKMI